MSRTHALLALALALSTASACDEVDDEVFAADDDIALRPGFGSTGIKFNTSAIGDHPLHELALNGNPHEDVKLEGVYIKAQKGKMTIWIGLDEVWAEKGRLLGRSGDRYFSDEDFIDSRWDVHTLGGGVSQRWMTIHKYRWDAASESHKYVFAYPMEPSYNKHLFDKYAKPIDGTSLYPLCAAEDGNIEAVLYEDTHVDMKSGVVDKQTDILNIACLSGALGKAGEWGYRPYDINHYEFQGIIRALRADYCGDGDSWTKPGTAIDIEDRWGIQKFFNPNHRTEAFWSPDGALCVTLPRRPEFTEVKCGTKILTDCGNLTFDNLGYDAMVWTKVP